LNYKVTHKSICTNRNTDTNETFGSERSEGDILIQGSQSRVVDDVVRNIEHNLLCDTIGEDGGLGDVEVKSSILLENTSP
jgi:hypothetical protein